MKYVNFYSILLIAILFSVQTQAQFYMGFTGGGMLNGVRKGGADGKIIPEITSMYGIKLGSQISDKWIYEMEFMRQDVAYTYDLDIDILVSPITGAFRAPFNIKTSYNYSYITGTFKFAYVTGESLKFWRTFGLAFASRNQFDSSVETQALTDTGGLTGNLNAKVAENLVVANGLDVALFFGPGVSYTTRSMIFNLEARVNYSLSNHNGSVVNKNKFRHIGLGVLAGVSFKLSKKWF